MITIKAETIIASGEFLRVFSISGRQTIISEPGELYEVCNYCHKQLHPVFVYLVKTLAEKELLVENFQLLCCHCWTKRRKG